MKIDLSKLPADVKKEEKSFKLMFKNLKKSQLHDLDDTAQALHLEVFEEIDCLDCGNCCRALGPRITHLDIQRMAKGLRVKAQDVVDRYLTIDEDNDYVFRSMPCPFLGDDNYCSIYEHRPKACREYPHTDRKKFFQIRELTILNAQTCPAAFEVLKRLKAEFSELQYEKGKKKI